MHQDNKIPLGAHIYSPRVGGLYYHHGIYSGNGKVIQYSGFSKGLCSGPINKVPLETFLDGNDKLHIRFYQNRLFSPKEIIARAESRLGEDKYNLFKNNCEHFSTWVHTKQEGGLEISKFLNKVIDIIVIVDKRTAIIKSVIGLYDHIKRKEMRIEGDRSFNVDSNGNIKTLNQNNWQKILKNIQNWRQSPLDTNKTPAEFIMQIFLKSIQLNTKQIQKIIPKVKDTLRNTYLIR